MLLGDGRCTSTPYIETRNLNMVMASLRNHVLSICSKSMVMYQGDSLFHTYTLYLKSDTVLSFATNHLPHSRVLLVRLIGPVLQSNTKLAKRFQQLQQTNKQLCYCRVSKSKKQHSSLVFGWYQLKCRLRDRLASGFSWSSSVHSSNGPAGGTPQTRQPLPTSFPVHYLLIVLPSDDAHLTLTTRRKINK